MTHRSTRLVAGTVLPGGLVLGGCTIGGDDGDAAEAEGSGAAPSPELSPEGVGETVDVLLAAAGEESVGLSGELPVLGSREAANGDGPYVVEFNGVAVRDELMTVVFTLRVGDEADGAFNPGLVFDDGRTAEGDGAAGSSSFSTDGVYVLDPAAGTRHLTAYDSEGRCVCSDNLNTVLRAGSAVVLSSTFAAPPEPTTTVDVVIPTVGPFTGVTIER